MIKQQMIYIKDIINAIEAILRFVENKNLDDFKNDDMTISAVIWKFEVIGEAAKNISSDITEKYKKVPWKEMARMRDRLIHGYQSINPEILWKTIKEKLPELPDLLYRILENIEKEA